MGVALQQKAAQGIGPVQHHHFFPPAGTGLHQVKQGGSVGIIPGTRVLNIKHHRVQLFQRPLGRRRAHVFVEAAAEQADAGQARARIYEAFRRLARLHLSPQSVLRRKQQRQSPCVVQRLHAADQLGIQPRSAGNQTQPAAPK